MPRVLQELPAGTIAAVPPAARQPDYYLPGSVGPMGLTATAVGV
jgi:hypothetical protein